MIDASVPISSVDKNLAGVIAEEFKPVLLIVNKWDLAQGKASMDDYAEYLAKSFPAFSYAPISLTTASEGINVDETVTLALQLYDQATHRVSTGELNAAIQDILKLRGPSHKSGTKPPKILYATQVSTAPPTIVCVVNDTRSFDTNYQRFLTNQLRQRLAFAEIPIRLLFKSRRDQERK
jgi:GTP-binding protein